MTLHRIALVLALACLSLSARPTLAAGADARQQVLVELFTSQGCSSCPPADDLLGELATAPGIVALSFHVDYWDYIGWRDPFAEHAYTLRQRGYGAALGQRYIYTPQMVIDGHLQAVGSRKREVMAAIEAARRSDKPISLELERAGRHLAVRLPESDLGGSRATLWVVAFDQRHETAVRRGENAGRALVNSNVVRRLQRVAEWGGEAASFDVELPAEGEPGGDGCVVFLQRGASGPILGLASN